MIYRIIYKDGTEYVFSSYSYTEEKQTFTTSRMFMRIRPHNRHPDCIHVDMFGVVTYFFTDGTSAKEQIVAFDDGMKIVRFD